MACAASHMRLTVMGILGDGALRSPNRAASTPKNRTQKSPKSMACEWVELLYQGKSVRCIFRFCDDNLGMQGQSSLSTCPGLVPASCRYLSLNISTWKPMRVDSAEKVTLAYELGPSVAVESLFTLRCELRSQLP